MHVIGVDGGQSTTLAVVATDNGNIIGAASAGPANHIHEPGGSERCRKTVQTVLQRVLASAGLTMDEISAIGMGMTGARPKMRGIIEEVLAEMGFAGPLAFVHDSVSTFEGALGGQPGCIVIAGTGAVALARGKSGREVRTGGWGYLFGDEGSAW